MIKGHEQWNDRNDNKTKQSCNDRVNKNDLLYFERSAHLDLFKCYQ